ncbi:hypothetical protein MASR2M15_28960 [Anaerolineales bacterium]
MRKHPVDFRKEEIYNILNLINAGESVSIIGVGSVGKTNLLQHLIDPEVTKHYLAADADKLIILILDSNMLGTLPDKNSSDGNQIRAWAGFELMLHRLYMSFYPLDILKEDAVNFYNAYVSLQDGSNLLYAYMGVRYFELGINFFLRRGYKLVLMFDEFEEWLKIMPANFFHNLRGLRDLNKSSLMFGTFSRMPITDLIDLYNFDHLALEPFTELFTDNLTFVGPYNENDAHQMVKSLMKRHQAQNLPTYVEDFLIYLTGAYAGLLRAGFNSIRKMPALSMEDVRNPKLIDSFAAERTIRAECDTIWNSLSENEHDVLLAMVQGKQLPNNATTTQAIRLLSFKKLIKINGSTAKPYIQPPIFDAYVKTR